jgi:hypothetical protein
MTGSGRETESERESVADGASMDDDRDLSPEQAFALLGNETRVAIVRALWESDDPLSFSDLREHVGVSDSGQFNYHLNKLLGRFVRHRDGEYELPYAGFRVIGAILSGTYTREGSLSSFELDVECVTCGTALEATYADEQVTVRCSDCDRQVSHFGFPPGALEVRDRDELTRTFDRWIRNVFATMADGICLNCAGQTEGSLTTDSEYRRETDDVAVEFVCQQCGDHATSSVGSYLFYHPAVVAFHYDHGIDLNEVAAWSLPWLVENSARIVAEDPIRVEYTVTLDGDDLDLAVDDELTVEVV